MISYLKDVIANYFLIKIVTNSLAI